jgi:hypothetical protein
LENLSEKGIRVLRGEREGRKKREGDFFGLLVFGG